MQETIGAARPPRGHDPSSQPARTLRQALAADAARAAARLDAAVLVAGIRAARWDALPVRRVRSETRIPASQGPVALRRTRDSVPIILGSILGTLMLVVFTVAAMFVRLAR